MSDAYNDINEPQTETEIISTVDAASALVRTEIDSQIATAHKYPRHLSRVAQQILNLVTLDEESAEECMYALPRGGKPISGPSIRFAEVVKAAYGNCRAAARVVQVDRAERVIVSEGIFHDLENNTATRAEVRRRISGKSGRIFSDDMIIMTGNAACAIALRNAILSGVPKALWRKAYDAVQRTIAGDITTLSVTRDKAIRALSHYGVAPEQIYQALGVTGIEDVTLENIPTLRGMFSALKNGEATVEEMFARQINDRAQDKDYNPLVGDKEEPAKTETKETVQETAVIDNKTVVTDVTESEDVVPKPAFGEYHRGLMRANQAKSVEVFDTNMKAHNPWANHPSHKKTLDAIKDLHIQRVTGKMAAKAFMDSIVVLVAE